MAENKEIKNSENLSEKKIFEKIKEDLRAIQENLTKKEITVDEAKRELITINEWIKRTNLEHQNKEKFWKAFDELIKLEKNIDENTLKDEVIEIIKLLNNLTKKDLAKLKQSIKWGKYEPNLESSFEAKIWRKESSKNLVTTINDASQDSNIIARTVGSRMKKLIS